MGKGETEGRPLCFYFIRSSETKNGRAFRDWDKQHIIHISENGSTTKRGKHCFIFLRYWQFAFLK